MRRPSRRRTARQAAGRGAIQVAPCDRHQPVHGSAHSRHPADQALGGGGIRRTARQRAQPVRQFRHPGPFPRAGVPDAQVLALAERRNGIPVPCSRPAARPCPAIRDRPPRRTPSGRACRRPSTAAGARGTAPSRRPCGRIPEPGTASRRTPGPAGRRRAHRPGTRAGPRPSASPAARARCRGRGTLARRSPVTSGREDGRGDADRDAAADTAGVQVKGRPARRRGLGDLVQPQRPPPLPEQPAPAARPGRGPGRTEPRRTR